MNNEFFSCRDIHKKYTVDKEAIHILKGIDLSLTQGDFVALLGPSGAGKSTLLYILSTLDAPDDGVIYLNGKEVTHFKENEKVAFRKKTGFVFQFYNLLPEFTVLENVMIAADIAGFVSEKERKSRAVSLLEELGLGHRIKHKPTQLSGGEQQRVSIARALINDPEIIFADEPTGNLDSVNAAEIIRILKDLNENKGKTIVMVTHNDEIAKLAKRNLHIIDGKIEER